jgi:ankyrin repeat protein
MFCFIDSKVNSDGGTPLIMAAQEGHLAVVKLLLEVGASANAKLGVWVRGCIQPPFLVRLWN